MMACLDRLAIYTAGRDVEAFLAEQMRVDAVAMNLLVIGEGASQLSPELKTAVPAPWPSIVGLRHRLAHAYPGVDPTILWTSAVERAPELRVLLAGLLEHR